MKYYCHVGAGAPSCFLDVLNKQQKRISRTVLFLLLNTELFLEM